MCLKEGLRSFKPKKELFYTFALDVIMVLILFLMIFSFSKILNAQAYALSEGKDVEQVKMELLSGSVEKSQQFAENMRSLALTLIIGGVFVLVIGLFIFSLSQAGIWYKLIGKKLERRNYWKWNVMIIVLTILFLIYALVYGVILLGILKLFIPQQGAWVYLLSAISMFFLLLAAWVLMLACYSFAHKYKVWESLGDTFHQIKIHWAKMWKGFLFSYAVLVLLNVIILGVLWGAAKLGASENVLLVINIALMLLYLAWLRVYIVEWISITP